MRKWWSSGIFFMPHPTTLGACKKQMVVNRFVHELFVWSEASKNQNVKWVTHCAFKRVLPCPLCLTSNFETPLQTCPLDMTNCRWDIFDVIHVCQFLSVLTSSLPRAMTGFSSVALSLASNAPAVSAKASTKKAHILRMNLWVLKLVWWGYNQQCITL